MPPGKGREGKEDGWLESMAQLWAGITTGRYSSWLFPSWREEAGPGGVDIGLQLHQGQVSPYSSSSSSSGSSADQAASTGP